MRCSAPCLAPFPLCDPQPRALPLPHPGLHLPTRSPPISLQVGETTVSKHLSTLKHLAGSRSVTVEAKHLDPTTLHDHRNFLFLSNHRSSTGSIMRDPATRPEPGLPLPPCARLCPRHHPCACSARSASSCHQEPPSPSTARRASSTASSSPPRSAAGTPSTSAMRIRSGRPSSRPSPLPPAPPRPPCLPPPRLQVLQAESEQYFSNLNEAQSQPETKYHFFWRAATPSPPHPPSRAPRVLLPP